MKPNDSPTRRPATAKARLSFVLALTLWLGGLPGLFAQAVPNQLNYQGILLDGQGNPVSVPTDVEFRIYDSPTLTTGLQWGRMFKITPDTNGAFNVVLSDEGAVLSDSPGVTLASVFNGTGSDSRYLELTVKDSTPISPRQRFVASPYAFLANGLTAAALQNFTISDTLGVAGAANVGSLTAVGVANVGSLTTVGSLTAAGTATVGALTSTGTATVGALTTTGAADVGSLTATGTANVTGTMTASNFVGYGTIPLGGIIMWSGTNVPPGWALCDGTTNNGIVTPDLRGRFVLGYGKGSGLTMRNLGEKLGEETHVLTLAEMPSHSHSVMLGNTGYPDGSGDRTPQYYLMDPYRGGTQGTYNTSSSGSNAAHNNMPPYYVLAYIMRVR